MPDRRRRPPRPERLAGSDVAAAQPPMRRWIAVGGVGVVCGLLLGWVLYSLTASVPAAVVVGAAVASILVGLAVGGVRQSRDFARTPDRVAEARARQAKVHEAMEQSRKGHPDTDH
jgi:hypothetical protein